MSTLKTNTLSNAAGSKSVPVDTVVDGTAKAWVNFNGTGTVAIRASFNVSSITDNGTGDYTVNFTTAMPDANYSANVGTAPNYAGAWAANVALFSSVTTTEVAPTTSAFRFNIGNTGGAAFDSKYITASIFR